MVEFEHSITLANGCGEGGTRPEIDSGMILFNGLCGLDRDDSHETMVLRKKRAPLEDWQSPERRGSDFCKTARKPYDLAVTACLAYLAAIEKKAYDVRSDGHGYEWLDGVAMARKAVPRLANQIDIPMAVMKGDRWTYRNRPGRCTVEEFQIEACIDGHAYVFEVDNEANCYRFDTPEDAQAYLAQFIEPKCKVRSTWNDTVFEEGGAPLFNASGAFDQARYDRIDRAQRAIILELLAKGRAEGRNIPPPAYARPVSMRGSAANYNDTAGFVLA